ncbi:DoxX family protein [Natronomonas amylolytica]|uniref:DoxX family protein n=1 Tax=Natronomonas amylolytica TaxID=3108498 RepID=UPI0030093859
MGVVSVVYSGVAAAHVRFVTNTEQAGEGLAFLADALTDPVNAAVLGGGGLATLGVLGLYLRVRPFQRDISVFRDVMTGYRDLLPWLLRLGFGLPLVGAGFAGYLFNPIVEPATAPGLARLFQIGLGFALLFGVATRAAAIIGLLAYLLALSAQPLLLYSFEWVPGFVAIALVGSGRPSADEVLQKVAAADGTAYGQVDPVHRAATWLNRVVDPYERFVPTVIRVGMGLSFAFLGLFEKLLAPEMALSVVEQYSLTALLPVPAELWVLGAGFAELGLGFAIMVGFFTRVSAITALSVFVLTLFGIPDDPVLAHIGLFSLASALLITGAGAYALDNRIGADKPAATHDGVAAPADD